MIPITLSLKFCRGYALGLVSQSLQLSPGSVMPAAAPARASALMKDFPKPNLEDTDNYRAGAALSRPIIQHV